MVRDELPAEWNREWDSFEREVRRRAQRFPYPPTPNLVPSVAGAMPPYLPPRATLSRRLAWALLVLAIVVAGLAAVEPVRAWVAEMLRLGSVRIMSPAPQPTRTAIPVHLGWGGKSSLAEAAPQMPFTVELPSQPPDLGAPDAVYVQDLNGPALLMVWMDPSQPRRVRMTLHTLSSQAMAYKMDPPTVEETQVNGQPALWTNGPYIVELGNGDWVAERLVMGHVLIWTEGDITYRLESDLPLEETVAIAESLQPLSLNK